MKEWAKGRHNLLDHDHRLSGFFELSNVDFYTEEAAPSDEIYEKKVGFVSIFSSIRSIRFECVLATTINENFEVEESPFFDIPLTKLI